MNRTYQIQISIWNWIRPLLLHGHLRPCPKNPLIILAKKVLQLFTYGI